MLFGFSSCFLDFSEVDQKGCSDCGYCYYHCCGCNPFWERLCGVGGVVVKEMGAVPKYGYGYWYGVGWGFPTMIAVPDPEEMQKQILELVGKKGRESKLTV